MGTGPALQWPGGSIPSAGSGGGGSYPLDLPPPQSSFVSNVQGYGRDPGFAAPDASTLSSALEITLGA